MARRRALLVALLAACGGKHDASAPAETSGGAFTATEGKGPALVALTVDDAAIAIKEIDAKVTVQGPLALTSLDVAFDCGGKRGTGKFVLALPEHAGFIGEAATASSPGHVAPAFDVPITDNVVHVTVQYIEELPTGAYVLPLGTVSGPVGVLDVVATAIDRDGKTSVMKERDTPWEPRDLQAKLPATMGAAIASNGTVVVRLDGGAPPAEDLPKQLVVLVDTSASMQVAPPDAELTALLAQLRAKLGDALPITVTAFDQTTAKVFDGKIADWGANEEGMLAARGAAGATDLLAALGGVPAGARVVLVSDAVPTIGAAVPAKLDGMIDRLDVWQVGRDEHGSIAGALAMAGARPGVVIGVDEHARAAEAIGHASDAIAIASPPHVAVWPDHAAAGGKPTVVYVTVPARDAAAKPFTIVAPGGKTEIAVGQAMAETTELVEMAVGMRARERAGNPRPPLERETHAAPGWTIVGVTGDVVAHDALRGALLAAAKAKLDACVASAGIDLAVELELAIDAAGTIAGPRIAAPASPTGAFAKVGACAATAIAGVRVTPPVPAAKDKTMHVVLRFVASPPVAAANAPALTGEPAKIAALVAAGNLHEAIDLARGWYGKERGVASAVAYGNALVAGKREDEARRVFGGIVERDPAVAPAEARAIAAWSLARTGEPGRKLAVEMAERLVGQAAGLGEKSNASALLAQLRDRGAASATANASGLTLWWGLDAELELVVDGKPIAAANTGGHMASAPLPGTGSHLGVRIVKAGSAGVIPGVVVIEKDGVYSDRPFLVSTVGAVVDLGAL